MGRSADAWTRALLASEALAARCLAVRQEAQASGRGFARQPEPNACEQRQAGRAIDRSCTASVGLHAAGRGRTRAAQREALTVAPGTADSGTNPRRCSTRRHELAIIVVAIVVVHVLVIGGVVRE